MFYILKTGSKRGYDVLITDNDGLPVTFESFDAAKAGKAKAKATNKYPAMYTIVSGNQIKELLAAHKA